MKYLFSPITALILALGLIIATAVLGWSVINRNNHTQTVSVTGLGELDFTSDLIVWEGSISQSNYELSQAYDRLRSSKRQIQSYLTSKGISPKQIIFSAVNSTENTRSIYNGGNYVGTEFTGYTLRQDFKVESQDINKIEKVAREVTELLNQGVELQSYSPQYYYTKLSEVKIDLIAAATADAKARAETIAQNAGSKLGNLTNASMGIFQITGQNSNEDYSWGGTFNTRDKEKTASITMKLSYEID